MVLCTASLGLCSIIHKHQPVLLLLLVLPLAHFLVLSLLSSPWFTYILLKSSYMSADQPERQRQAWVNYLSFRADGCRWYVNVCVCVCVYAPAHANAYDNVCVSVCFAYVCDSECDWIYVFAYLQYIVIFSACLFEKMYIHTFTHEQKGRTMLFISAKGFCNLKCDMDCFIPPR